MCIRDRHSTVWTKLPLLFAFTHFFLLKSASTYSGHRFLGFPTRLVPPTSPYRILFACLSWSVATKCLSTWPNQLVLLDLTDYTVCPLYMYYTYVECNYTALSHRLLYFVFSTKDRIGIKTRTSCQRIILHHPIMGYSLRRFTLILKIHVSENLKLVNFCLGT